MGRSRPMRVLVANGRAARSIAVEFGPAEAIDSILIRPVTLYVGPFLVGNVAVGFVLGSVAADVAFYVMAIASYERFKSLLAVRTAAVKSHLVEEGQDGSVVAAAAA